MQTNGGGGGGGRSCSDGESAGLRQACASCKHQRKRCAEDCFLAKYFPAEKQGEFRAVQKVFGLSNLTKMLRANATEAARQRAARTLAWEAEWRDRDPADGCFREVAELRCENRLLRDRIAALTQALTCQYPTLPPLPQFLDHDALQNDTVSIILNNNGNSNSNGSNNLVRENLSYYNFCNGPVGPVLGATSISSPPSFVDQSNFSPFNDDDEESKCATAS